MFDSRRRSLRQSSLYCLIMIEQVYEREKLHNNFMKLILRSYIFFLNISFVDSSRVLVINNSMRSECYYGEITMHLACVYRTKYNSDSF